MTSGTTDPHFSRNSEINEDAKGSDVAAGQAGDSRLSRNSEINEEVASPAGVQGAAVPPAHPNSAPQENTTSGTWRRTWTRWTWIGGMHARQSLLGEANR